jgi:hypothetical protein
MLGLAKEFNRTRLVFIISVNYKISICELFMRTAQVLYNKSSSVIFLDFIERNFFQKTKKYFDFFFGRLTRFLF